MGNLLRTDILDRGIPWTLLILRAGRMPNDLNIRWHQRVAVAGVALMLGLATLATLTEGGRFVTTAAALTMLVLGSYWVTEVVQAGTSRSFRLAFAISLAGLAGLAAIWQLD